MLLTQPPLPLLQMACRNSSLGYHCAYKDPQGFAIHYSQGAYPPDNACVRAANSDRSRLISTGPAMFHWAMEANTKGWVGLGFAWSYGEWQPAYLA